MPTARHDDSIGRLCIALAHRWEPERLFVIFTAYFDESGTHVVHPRLILSAYLGHAYQWRRFETKLGRIQRDFGFTLFHAKDFARRRREFSRWSEDKCGALIRELTVLVQRDLTEGLTVSLTHERYMQEYRAPPIPKGMPLDSQYGVCFRACVGRLIARLDQRGNRDQLNIVMEGGHKNVGDCDRIFHAFKKRWASMGADVFGTFTTAGKDCKPLMAADMLAYAHSIALSQIDEGVRLPPQLVLPSPAPGRGVLAFLELQEDALTGLKEGWATLKELEAEQRQAARAARKASEGSA